MDYKRINRNACMNGCAVRERECRMPYAGSVSARTVMNGMSGTVKPEKPLAMMYSPYQYFEEIYPAEKGFSAGTIFIQLDLPCTACTSCRMQVRGGMRHE